MSIKVSTFKHTLQGAGWGDPDDNPGAVAQRIVRGKQVGPSIFYDQDPTVLDHSIGYDYANREEWRVFGWDDNFVYLQETDDLGTGFIQVPKNPSAYHSEPIVVVEREE